MGREIRIVSINWKHPRDQNGVYIPLLSGSYEEAAKQWDYWAARWEKGFCRDYRRWMVDRDNAIEFEKDEEPISKEHEAMTYAEYTGARPEERDYMPVQHPPLGYQMYENTSEGTPISPVFATREEVAKWCHGNQVSIFGNFTASYEEWLAIANGDSSTGAVFIKVPK